MSGCDELHVVKVKEEEEGELDLEDDIMACINEKDEEDEGESEEEGGLDEEISCSKRKCAECAVKEPRGVLFYLGEDILIRITSMLAPTYLCCLSMACKWTQSVACRDNLWKCLYFQRWTDPKSHNLEKHAIRAGWKKVYASRDIESRMQDEDENDQTEEDAECQEAFRAMQAAKRSLSLNTRTACVNEKETFTSMDEIHDAIQEFKSHCVFPYQQEQKGSIAVGRDQVKGDLFGKEGFYTTFTEGALMMLLRPKLNKLPRQHQMEICVCKLTGTLHICSREGSAQGCDLVCPNDDGYFVCPVTGIIWSDSRCHEDEVEEDAEGACEPDSYEGGSKNFCNMVTQGYECDRDPSDADAMGWGSWLEDRMGCGVRHSRN